MWPETNRARMYHRYEPNLSFPSRVERVSSRWNFDAKSHNSLPLVKVQLRRCSWFCLGIPHGFYWSTRYPFQSQFLLPKSEPVGILEDSHSSQLLFAQHQGQSLQVLLPLCSDPWPSCFQLHFVQTQNCLDGKSDQRDQNELNPWFQVPDQPEQLLVHIFHQWLHCSRRWFFPIEDQSHRGMYQLGRFHARLRLPAIELEIITHILFTLYDDTPCPKNCTL